MIDARAESACIKHEKSAETMQKLRSRTGEKLDLKLFKNLEWKIDYLQEKGVRTWLAETPSYSCETVLCPLEFRDDCRERYCLPLFGAPTHCDGCGQKCSVTHLIGYKFGGLFKSRHDESRDTLICLVSSGLLLSNARGEPIINPCRDTENVEMLRDPSPGIEAELSGE